MRPAGGVHALRGTAMRQKENSTGIPRALNLHGPESGSARSDEGLAKSP